MAQNLFEKYGIKEVADVTLYRIERKDVTYESQRKISISSILKGALTKETVYPLDADGKGEADGYEAYVFKDADILSHYNYDCDDVIETSGAALFVDKDNLGKDNIAEYLESAEAGKLPHLFEDANCTITSMTDLSSGRDMMERYAAMLLTGFNVVDVDVLDGGVIENGTTTEDSYGNTTSIMVTYKSYIVAPEKAYNVSEEDIADIHGATWEDGTATFDNAYITFDVPRNSAPEVVRAAFAEQQAKLYNSLSVIVRFTQPIISTGDGNIVNGTVTAVINDGTNNHTITIAYTKAPVASNIYMILHGDTITKAQLITLLTETYEDPSTVVITDADDIADNLADDKYVATSIVFVPTTYNVYIIKFTAQLSPSGEAETGNYDLNAGDAEGHYHMDTDFIDAGTHEFTYQEQICMLFAKNQNLITKAGTRYQFTDANSLFPGFEFNDNFATAPNSSERIVVVGLTDKLSINLYDEEEVFAAIRQLTDIIEAKAYNVVYTDYAELVVENEMGYYLPQQLGYSYDKKNKTVSFFDANNTYAKWANALKGSDIGIESAIYTWGDDKHYSINDAIDALKQESKLIDGNSETATNAFTRVFGGYKVVGRSAKSTLPLDDVNRVNGGYEDYTINGRVITDIVSGQKLSSGYTLDNVLTALATADLDGITGQIRIDATAETESNRAIYVDSSDLTLSNRANIYILKNVNGKALASDKDGIFELYDKNGNKLYYQDKVFAKTATLALVVIGTRGLIFVVERYGTKKNEKIAWMVKERGYITDKQAEKIVKNGLIHTVSITECDETFDATCTVGSIKVRKTKKNVLHYVPVLFLDTLKVSTLSQASESTDATGGKGNAKLITWDYGKEITLDIQDALYTPASMAAIWGGEHGDLKNGVKDTHVIDRMEKITAKRSFIVPAGNQEGAPTEGDMTAQAVYYDPKTMEPFQDGTPIAEGEVIYKFTRSVAYDGNSIGNTIEISADGFPGTYRVVGETMVRDKTTGEDQRFQFIIPEAKMTASDTSITLEADGDPVVFDFSMTVLRPDNGIMMKFVQFDVEENEEENDGSTMVKNTENLNLLDDAEMYKVSGSEDEDLIIGATEY